jgi:uncharacterized protein (TIGR02145 family)
MKQIKAIVFLGGIIFSLTCTKHERDNPFDPQGTNWHPPIVTAMNDTIVAITDSFYIHASGTAKSGSVAKYLWALDGVNYSTSTEIGRLKVAFVTVGVKKLFVKVRGDDGVESLPDSVKLTVKDNPPVNITPSNGVTVTTAFPTMSWIPGWYADSFTVLIDTVNPPSAIAKSGNIDSFFTSTTVLNPGKTYYWQVVGYNALGQEAHGDVWKFNAPTIIDIDGNIYTTVKIGNQTWMVENFKATKYSDGTAIPLVTDNWGNLTTPGYCLYNNDTTNKAKYGALYNWYTVNPANPKKIAPAGWHVPTDAEWDILQNYLIANGYNWDGTTTGNKIAKAMATKSDWNASTSAGAIGNDLTKNNASGFSALPGGYRQNNDTFYSQSNYGYWWSSTENDTALALHPYLHCNYDYLSRARSNKRYGFSVRVVRD